MIIETKCNEFIDFIDFLSFEIKFLRLHFQFLNLMNLNFIESNPQPVKTALAAMGRNQEVFRLPMCQMEDASKQKLLDELRSLELI